MGNNQKLIFQKNKIQKLILENSELKESLFASEARNAELVNANKRLMESFEEMKSAFDSEKAEYESAILSVRKAKSQYEAAVSEIFLLKHEYEKQITELIQRIREHR